MNLFFSVKDQQSYAFSQFDQTLEVDPRNTNQLHNIFSRYIHSPACFVDNQRRGNCHIFSSALPIDIDDSSGKTIEDVKVVLNSLNVNYIIYPSKNHNKNKNGVVAERFHVLIIPPEHISDKNVYKSSVKYFTELLNGDRNCTDLARYFYFTPDLKPDDVHTKLDGDFDFSKIETKPDDSVLMKQFTPSTNLSPVMNFFDSLCKNFHKHLLPARFNESNGSINYFRNNADKVPGLFQLFDSKYVVDKKKESKTFLGYSPEDVADIKECDPETTRRNLSQDLNKELKRLRESPGDPEIVFILTNEGVGKSTAFLNAVKPGEIIVTKDKKRLDELYRQYEDIHPGKRLIHIQANTDIIFTNVFEQRKQRMKIQKAADEAHDIVDLYSKWLQNTEYQKLRQQIRKIEGKTTYENVEYLTIKLFCKKYSIYFRKEEVEMILSFYQQQMRLIQQKKDEEIFITTIHKFNSLTKHTDIFEKKIVHVDEYCPDMFIPGVIHTEADGKKTYHMLKAHALAETEENGNRYLFSTVYDSEFVIEYNKNKPLNWKDTRMKLIIYTTEELPILIHQTIDPDITTIIDHRHHIMEDNLHIINVQSLNSRERGGNGSGPYKLKKQARTQFVFDQMVENFDLEPDMVVTDGIRHKQNMANIQGSNYHLKKIQTDQEKKSFGIIMKHPHPTHIVKYLPLFVENYLIKKISHQEIQNFNEYLAKYDIASFLLGKIVSDLANQAIGRVAGYRREENLDKIYLVCNAKVFQRLNLYYVTDKIFRYSAMMKDRDKRIRFPDVWEFLDITTFGLHLTESDYREIKSAKRKTISKYLATKDKGLKRKLRSLFKDRKWMFDIKKISKLCLSIIKANRIFKLLTKRSHKIKIYPIKFLQNFYERFYFAISKYITNSVSTPVNYDEVNSEVCGWFNFKKFMDLYLQKYAFKT